MCIRDRNLIKPGLIDDLIGDAYAHLYDTIGRKLWAAYDANGRTEPDDGKVLDHKPSAGLHHMLNLDGAAPSTPVVDDAALKADAGQADQAPAKRKMGVGRREIRVCAELCASKGGAAASEHSSKPIPQDRVQIIIPPRRKDDGSLEGSVHDDADDESELSEIDEDAINSDHEDILMRPMFPGLARQTHEIDDTMEGEDEDEDEAEEDVVDHDENGDVVMEEAEGVEEEYEEGDEEEQQDEEDIDAAEPLSQG